MTAHKAIGRRGKSIDRDPGLPAELGVLALVGLFLGIIGPFGTDVAPVLPRLGYWVSNIVGGGLIGIAFDRLLVGRVKAPWPRVFAVSLLMTPLVTLLVIINATLFFGHRFDLDSYLSLLWQVFVIALPVMIVRMLTWRTPQRIVERLTLVSPPMPEAEATFRRRLSARRRSSRLIALQAEDHYVRVHTEDGAELLTMRFSDAVEELSGAHGIRVHRSWWVSAEAIESARWGRASGEVRLSGGLAAPVSRSGAPLLRAAGWL